MTIEEKQTSKEKKKVPKILFFISMLLRKLSHFETGIF